MLLEAGTRAPSFSLPDQDGLVRALDEYRGSRLILYFYPKDDTPGCTLEAVSLGESVGEFEKHGAKVVGVSADSIASHKKFCTKYTIPFPLLSDESKEMLAAYGVWQEKSFMGKKHMGIVRTTYVIDSTGVIEKVFPRVNPVGHREALLAFLDTRPS